MKKNMKMLCFITLFINVILFINVNALSVDLTLECSSNELMISKSMNCDVILDSDSVINNIKFDILSNDLDITFLANNDIVNSGSGNNINLSKDIISTGKIGTLNILATDNVSVGNKTIVLSNVSIFGDNLNDNLENVTKDIVIIAKKSSNNTLNSLKINNVTVPSFSSVKNNYEDIIVNTNKIVVEASSEYNVQIEGDGEHSLALGKNTIDVTVTAEDGSINIYKLIVTYELPKSDDNFLKTLELFNDDEMIDFYYDASKNNFDIQVLSSVSEIKIMSTLNDEKASYVKNYGNRNVSLKYGLNKVQIRVKAEDDSVKYYTLNITRLDDRDSNNLLSYLVVNNKEVDLSDNIFEYKVDVRYIYKRSVIEAGTVSEDANVSFEEINLVDGENEPIIITVTAHNGEKREYKIVINRLSEEESKVVLKDIVIDGYDFDFQNDKYVYDLKIKQGERSLKITPIPEFDLSFEVLGNDNLQDGSTIIIRITDDDSEKTYTINIYKDIETIMGIPTLIFCYGVLGIGIISLAASIIYVTIKNRKSRNIE